MERSIVFFGTPDFASYSLKEIVASGIKVKAVVTAPDRPAGRGYQVQESDVKKTAIELGIPFIQPERLKNASFLDALKKLEADLFVVIAFRMLPKEVWAMPALGTINLHASLLPQYRGAAPINYALINGERQTGVTSFFIDEEIDTGAILLQKSLAIEENEDFGFLYERLKHLGASLIVETCLGVFTGGLEAQSQKHYPASELKLAHKIQKEDCRIDWSKTAREVHNLIRGLSPHPAAFTEIKTGDAKNERFKVYKSEISSIPCPANAKEVLFENARILLPCSDYYLSILELQRAGKRKMSATEFLSGFNTQTSWYLD